MPPSIDDTARPPGSVAERHGSASFVTERVGVVGLGHMAMPLDGCVSATGDADAGPDQGAAFTMAKYQYRARKPRPRRLSYGPYATVGQAPL